MLEFNNILQILGQGWVGTFIGIIGILIAIYQYFSSAKAIPTFQYFGQNIISNNKNLLPSEVSVLYNGSVVDRLSLTYIAFWNDGKATIRSSDIAEKYPLSFTFRNGIILNSEIIKTTKKSIDAHIEISRTENSKLNFGFSYLDARDGFLIKVLHTSDFIKPEFGGAIMGVPKGVRDCGEYSYYQYFIANDKRRSAIGTALRRILRPSWQVATITFIIGTCLIILSFLPDSSQLYIIRGDIDTIYTRIMLIISGIAYISMAISMYFTIRKRFPAGLNLNDK